MSREKENNHRLLKKLIRNLKRTKKCKISMILLENNITKIFK